MCVHSLHSDTRPFFAGPCQLQLSKAIGALPIAGNAGLGSDRPVRLGHGLPEMIWLCSPLSLALVPRAPVPSAWYYQAGAAVRLCCMQVCVACGAVLHAGLWVVVREVAVISKTDVGTCMNACCQSRTHIIAIGCKTRFLNMCVNVSACNEPRLCRLVC